MPSLKQTSFAGGLVSDKLLGKTDQQKYANGLRTCRNFWITRYGTAENRPGTQFIGAIHDMSQTDRLIKFVFNNQVSYLLEFSDGFVTPYHQGARISTTGAPAYAGGTAYVIGNVVTSVGLTYVCIQAGTGHTPASSPTYWLALTGDLLVIPSAMTQATLTDLRSVQQNDIMTLVEQAVAPQTLKRFSDTQWTSGPFVQTAGVAAPTGAAVSIGRSSAGATAPVVTATGGNAMLPQDLYVVAVIGSNNVLVPGNATASTVGGADGANPVAVSWTASGGLFFGYYLYKLVAADYRLLKHTDAATTSFSDDGTVTPTTQLTIFGNSVETVFYVVTAVSDSGGEGPVSNTASGTGLNATSDFPNLVSWSAVAGASSYRVYRKVSGVEGFIGASTGLSFSDYGIAPDFAIQPATPLGLFSTANDYPAVVGYYQQRLCFANSINAPTQVNMSRVSDFGNFQVSTPIQDDDAVSFTIAGVRNEGVQHLVDLGRLIIHTASSEFVANGNQAGAITPLSIGLVRQGSSGASAIPPIVIGNTDLFVQARGGFVRDLRYEIQSTGYQGKDLTAYAPDLFANRTIVSMDWQQIPHSILWAALDDGTLLGCTYSREQDIWAWHEHDLTGNVEQVCVVPEATEDVVYLVVKRTINGGTTRYIERLANRAFATIDEAVFCDSALSFDGRNTSGTTMQVDPQTPNHWTPQDPLSLTSFPPSFFPTDVGRTMVFQQVTTETTYDPDGVRIPVGTVTDQVTFTLITYLSANAMMVQSDKDVPTWAQGAATTTWGWADTTFSGLDHLEGESVVGLGDGDVMPARTVTGGSITTDVPYLRLTVGLPIQADLQTLPIENTQGETIMNKKATVAELTANFYQTRGGNYGQDAEHLDEWVQRQDEAWSDPVALFTGPVRIPVQGAWQTTAQLWIRQTDPLPIGISALVVSASIAN